MEVSTKSFKNSSLLSIILIIINVVNSAHFQPRYQPELDQMYMEEYITNDQLFNLHINCLLFDGPCNRVGQWMKPRMASYFLSSCILCTINQEKEMDKFMTWLYDNHPQLFRMGISKYLDANGITLPADSKFREQVQKMNVPKVAVSSAGAIKQQKLQKAEEQNQHQQTLPSQKVSNANSRKNKFSSAMFHSQTARTGYKANTQIEDDEAEMDFKTYH